MSIPRRGDFRLRHSSGFRLIWYNVLTGAAKGGGFIKNTANMITASRVVFSFGMLIAYPFDVTFWICYLCGGFTDMLDGFIARRMNQQSSAGAKLDSIADLFFSMAIMIIVISNFVCLCGFGYALV